MNIKDCPEIVTNQEYIRKRFGVRYRLNANDILRLKDKTKHRQGLVEITSNSRALSRV